jgi:hypothetical protein
VAVSENIKKVRIHRFGCVQTAAIVLDRGLGR